MILSIKKIKKGLKFFFVFLFEITYCEESLQCDLYS